MGTQNWLKAGALFALLVLTQGVAACGGKGGLLGSSGTSDDNSHKLVLPAVNLDGWALPEMPEAIPPQPANMRELRDRLAPLTQPENAAAREASGVIKTLLDDSLNVANIYPNPGFFDFRVSTPFNAASPAELTVEGSIDYGAALRAGTFVQVGLVTAATYEFAMNPDGDPLTNDAQPEYLFNQNALMLLANDASGNPFVAPFDYNASAGIGAPQAVGGPFDFALRFTPDVLGGGQMALSVNGGAFGANREYKKNNWGWWADEDYSNVRLVIMAYSFNPDPAAYTINFSGIVADDPAYVTPPTPDWVHSWGTGAVEANLATAVAPDGSVYSGGYISASPTPADALLQKFDQNGQPLWNKSYGGTGIDIFNDLAVDAAGNVYAVGYTTSFGAGGSDVLLVKFDPAGNILLQQRWGHAQDNVGTGVALDASGNILVCGQYFNAGSAEALLVEFQPNGAFIRARGWGGSGTEEANEIVVGSDGNIYVVGTHGALSWEAFILQFPPGGGNPARRIWGGTGDDMAFDIARGEPGFLYVTGYTNSAGAGQNDAFVLKVNEATMGLTWQRTWGTSELERGTSLGWNSVSGTLFVGGFGNLINGWSSRFVTELTSAGTLVGAECWRNPGVLLTQTNGSDMAMTTDGGYVIGGGIPNVNSWIWEAVTGATLNTTTVSYSNPGNLAVTVPAASVTPVTGTVVALAGAIDTGAGANDNLTIKHMPGGSGIGPGGGAITVDMTALPNANFTLWSPVGPTPLTTSMSTNMVLNASLLLGEGDQFYVTVSPDNALAPNDLQVYPSRPDGASSGLITVVPGGLTVSVSLAPYFEVPVASRTLRLKPGAYTRVTNDLSTGLPGASYTVKDFTTSAVFGGPYSTDDSGIQRLVLAAGTQYQLTFAPRAYPLAGSTPAGSGAAEVIYPAEWPANWFTVGGGSLSIGGAATPAAIVMQSFYNIAGSVATLQPDAFARIELNPGTVNPVANPPYTIVHQAPATQAAAGTFIAGPFTSSANPPNVLVVRRGITFRARDSVGNDSGTYPVDPGRLLNGATSLSRNFGAAANGNLLGRILPVRVVDDPALSDPAANVTGLGPWNASLSFLLQYGTAPYTVEFDGDYGTTWNDGVTGRTYAIAASPYSSAGFKTQAVSLTNHSPGDYRFALRVTDATGAQYVHVWPGLVNLPATGWTPSLPQPDNGGLDDRGWYASGTLIGGRPAVAYYDFTNEDLMYVRALDANGGSWGTAVAVDGTGGGDTGWLPCLAEINGRPAISYVQAGGGAVRYRRADDATGSAWTAASVNAVTGLTYLSSSLTTVNNRPAIAAWGSATGVAALVYVRADNANGTTWPAAAQIANSSAFIPGPIPQVSLQVVDGNPAVAYHHNGDARYIRATNQNGGAWAASVVADNGSGMANVGAHPRLLVVNGNPAIAHYDYTNGALRYVRATDTTGAAWGASQVLDNTNDSGQFPSLAIINGLPAISYWNTTADSLMYMQSTDASGSAWPASGTLVDSNQCGDWNTLFQANGQAAISYYGSAGGQLRYIRLY